MYGPHSLSKFSVYCLLLKYRLFILILSLLTVDVISYGNELCMLFPGITFDIPYCTSNVTLLFHCHCVKCT